MKLTGYIITVILLVCLVGCASAAHNIATSHITSNKTVPFGSSYNTSKINSINISITSDTVNDPYSRINTTNMIAWYKMDTGNGTSVIDSSGQNHNSSSSADLAWTTGKYNNALQFNGATSIFTVPVTGMTINNTMTFACWFMTNNTTKEEQTIITQKAGGDGRNYDIYLDNGYLAFHGANGDDSSTCLYDEYTINANQWYFMAFVVNSHDVTLYVWDGIEWYTETYTTSIIPIKSSTMNGDFAIGGVDSDYEFTMWSGAIDNIMIWNTPQNYTFIQSIVYDPITNITAKIGNNSASNNVTNNSGAVSVPFSVNDGYISLLQLIIPSTTISNGIMIYNYSNSITPFNATIGINYSISADFAANITSFTAPRTVQFNRTNNDTTTSILWDFGDGNTSTVSNPIHTYYSGGHYNVSLTLEADNNTDSITKTEYINVYVPNPTNITWSGYNWTSPTSGAGEVDYGTTNGSVWIDNQGKMHLAVRNINNQWYSAEIDQVNYTKYGTYIWSIESPLFEYDKNVVAGVFTYYNGTEELDFESSLWGGFETDNCWLTNQPTEIVGNQYHTLLTDNGNPYEVKIIYKSTYVQYYVNRSGSILAQLNVTNASQIPTSNMRAMANMWIFDDSAKPSNNQTQELVLNSFSFIDVIPFADFESSIDGATLDTQFTDLSLNTPTSWQWNFGDGSANSTSKNPAHTYNESGTYVVTLTTANNEGSNTVVKTVIVAWSPITMRLNSIDVSTDSAAIELVSAQNNLYETVTSTISSGYILGSLMVLVLAGAGIMRFLGFL